MLRAIGEDEDGHEFYVCGLTQENIDRLMSDQPIHMTSSSIGKGASYPDVFIVGGKTYEDVERQLLAMGLIQPHTLQHLDKRRDSMHPQGMQGTGDTPNG